MRTYRYHVVYNCVTQEEQLAKQELIINDYKGILNSIKVRTKTIEHLKSIYE